MIVFSGFFSGMEIAFVSSNRLKQELDLKRNLLNARILSVFYNNPSRFIGSLLLGNNIALVIYGMAMAKLLEPAIVKFMPGAILSEFSVLLVQTIISTLLILITAEFIPKVLFRINPNSTLKFFSIPVWIFYYSFYPFILLYIGFSEFILKRLFRVRLSSKRYQFSSIDLEEYVNEYKSDEEKREEFNQEIQMIQNAMGFKNIKLRDCMVPRTEINALEINENIKNLIELFTQTGHSKIMIYEESIDKIIGYVHSFDMFENPQSIKKIVRKANVYPETMAANELLKEFIKSHRSVAIVVDEFGGTSGIVTMEDIIEEIFGEIEDEYDFEETVEKQISEKVFIFSARLEIDYLNDKYKFEIPVSDEYETLAGFIIQFHESIPEKSEEILIPPFKFKILKASGNRLDEVKMELI
jgi:putative hemolysin